MNDTLAPVRAVQTHRHPIAVADRTARLTLVDRASVRVGLWLLLRAERHAAARRDIDRVAAARTAARAWQDHDLALARARVHHNRII